MNSGHTCLLHKGFCTGYFGVKENNAVTLPHIAQKKHAFLEEIKKMSETKKLPSRNKIALELLYQRLGHRSTRSFLNGDTENVWEDLDLLIYLDPFCTSCQIYLMNKKARYKIILNPRAPLKWFLIDIIPSTAQIFLTSDTNFSNYILIVDA